MSSTGAQEKHQDPRWCWTCGSARDRRAVERLEVATVPACSRGDGGSGVFPEPVPRRLERRTPFPISTITRTGSTPIRPWRSGHRRASPGDRRYGRPATRIASRNAGRREDCECRQRNDAVLLADLPPLTIPRPRGSDLRVRTARSRRDSMWPVGLRRRAPSRRSCSRRGIPSGALPR